MKAFPARLATLALAGTLLAPGVLAREPRTALATASAQAAGFSPQRLAQIRTVMQSFVEKGDLPGVVTLVARNGRVVDLSAVGMQDVEKKTPMRTDSIFRIASMSKLITTVAVMTLFEDGRLLLADPVARFVPQFKGPKVMSADGTTTEAGKEITIRDLLTHRSGITYGFLDRGPVGDAYRKAGISDGLALSEDATVADMVKKLADAPLVSVPGKEFHYGLSTDVLGRVIEIVSGKDLETYLTERILRPLRMNDTSFAVPEAKWPRLATAYALDESGRLRPMKDPEVMGPLVFSPEAYYRAPKKYFSGGAGLASTASDYGRFLQMLLNGGELDGARIIGRKSVELMTVSHTSDLPRGAVDEGKDFGLGVTVVTDLGATRTLGSQGAYSCGGIYGSTCWVDPKEKLVGVLMTQRFPWGAVGWRERFRALVYQALN